VLYAGYILTALTAYLLGSVPTGFLVGKAQGIDLRKVGSGNIGATNALRTLGKTAGTMVLLADALKGWIAVALVAPAYQGWLASGCTTMEAEWFRILAAVCAVLGHNYTVWLHFKGGKGIATSAGVLLALVPLPLAIILTVWIIILLLSRYVSLASIAASSTLPFATWICGYSTTMIAVTAVLTALALYKHRSNIQRLAQGTEHRFTGRSEEPEEPRK